MVKIEMYKAFDGKVFENMENCMTYEKNEQRKREMQYKKLEELKQKFDEYCEMCDDDCKDCIFERNCADICNAITEEMKRLEGE